MRLLIGLSLSCSILCVSPALAGEPNARRRPNTLEATVTAAVKQNLLTPLAKRDKERSEYSRAPAPPMRRQVRVLDSAPQKDATGASFVRIAIDARYSYDKTGTDDGWVRDQFVGCFYVDSEAIFLKRGKRAYRSAKTLLGKDADEPADTVCVPANATVAAVALP